MNILTPCGSTSFFAPPTHLLAPQENGADTRLSEIKETNTEKELVDALQLLPVKAKLVLGRVAKWEPPQPLNEAQLSAKKVPGLKELWSCARSAGSRTRARRRSSSLVCWSECFGSLGCQALISKDFDANRSKIRLAKYARHLRFRRSSSPAP